MTGVGGSFAGDEWRNDPLTTEVPVARFGNVDANDACAGSMTRFHGVGSPIHYLGAVTMSVYERLGEIRGCILAARQFERLGRDNPAVLDAVISVLLDAADLAAGLPTDVPAAHPDLPWQDLGTLAAWRDEPGERLSDRVWPALDAIEPLANAVIAAAVVDDWWDGDIHDGSRPKGWFDTPDGGKDYSYADQIGAVAGAATLIVPGAGVTYACPYFADSGLWIQIPDQAAGELGGNAGMHRWARTLGMGRVRKDGSTPLEPPPDRIWVQRAFGDATLVTRHDASETGYAYLRLGELPRTAKTQLAITSRLQTRLFVSADFLPAALWSVEQTLIAAGQAWGALVSATIEG
jgi:hypothetical protein